MNHPYGILWHYLKPGNIDLEQAVTQASARHYQRLGVMPNVVYARPDEPAAQHPCICGLDVRIAAHITPAHIWLCHDPALNTPPAPTVETNASKQYMQLMLAEKE